MIAISKAPADRLPPPLPSAPPAHHHSSGGGPKALGSQLLVEMYACDARVLDDVAAIAAAMREAAVASGATIVAERFHHFSPHGVSGVVVIAESHLAIHTWPEHRYAAVDLFTCGDSIDQDRCFEVLRARLASERFSMMSVARGHMAAIRDPR